MPTPEDDARKRAQRQALQVHGGGALINTKYQSRTTTVVAVNENDLRDLLSLDETELAFMAIGQFMLAGAVWILAERFWGSGTAFWTPLTGFCAAATLFGIIMIVGALRLRWLKRAKIRKIFDETTEVSA